MIAFLRVFLSFAAFAIGFAMAAGVLSRVVKPPRISGVNVKLDWLAARPSQYDILIVGSSRMKQLMPSLLDSELAAAGMPLTTFNLAVDGMRPPEDSHTLDHALATRTGPLKFIFMEANPIYLKIDEEEEETDRLVYWHDNARMAAIWRRAFAHSIAKPPWFGKWVSDTWRNVRFAAEHTRYWGWNSARYGIGSEKLHNWLGLAQHPRFDRGMGVLNDGYVPNDSEPMDESELKGYNQALTKILKTGRKLDPMDSASQAEFARSAALARKHGARLVIIAPPTTTVEVIEPQRPPGSDFLFLDFSNPAEYPELFVPAMRLNGGHVNAEGSKLLTRLVARKLAAEIQKVTPPPAVRVVP